jgi:hypothetical protein
MEAESIFDKAQVAATLCYGKGRRYYLEQEEVTPP